MIENIPPCNVDIDETKKNDSIQALSISNQFLLLLFPLHSSHHGAFDVVMWTGRTQWKRMKTKVKKNKVRVWSMRALSFAHFQWVACGDIDLFIFGKHDEVLSAWDRVSVEVGKNFHCLWKPRKCRRVFPSSSVLRMLSLNKDDLRDARESSSHCQLFLTG